jgi:hypothetical protein
MQEPHTNDAADVRRGVNGECAPGLQYDSFMTMLARLGAAQEASSKSAGAGAG